MVASVLSAGSVAVIHYNADDPSGIPADTISFVLLQPVGSGTQIFFTDRAWDGSTFAAAGGNEGTFTFTAGSDLAAGSVITISTAELQAAGINLADTGETLYVYQGTDANTPTQFLYAVDMADGNTTFDGNLTGTGLTAGTHTAAIGLDNASFGTRGNNIQIADLLQQIGNPTDWVQNDNSPQTAPGGPFFTAPDTQLWVAASNGGEAIAVVNADGTQSSNTVGYRLAQAFQNDPNLFHPSDITLDTVHDRFFMIDADLNGNNRVVQGSISQVLNNPGAPISLTVLYSNAGSGATGSIRTLSVDPVNQQIFFDLETTFNRIAYDTAGQTPTELANLGSGNFITQATIDYVHGEVYLGSSQVESIFGTDFVSQNYIYRAGGLTPGSTSLDFTQLPFTPDDAGLGPEGSPLGGEAWPVERGTIRGVDVDPVNHDLYIVTGTVILDNDGNGSTTYFGGVYRYDLDSNPTGTVTQLYVQDGSTGPVGLLYYIEVDPNTGRYYVADETGISGDPSDAGIWTGSLTTPGTPTLFATIGNINGLVPQGLELHTAPTLTMTDLAATGPEAAGNPSAPMPPVTPANNFNSNDIDSGTHVDQLAGAQVRISTGFLSGAGHQDVLTISGTATGTLDFGSQDITYNYDSTTGVMTLSGVSTLDNYESALGLVRFQANGDNPTNYGATLNLTRTLSYSLFDGLLYSDEQNAVVTVAADNDAPVNTVPGTGASGTEDAGPIVIAGLSVTDVDADPANQDITVQLQVAHGTLDVDTSIAAGLSVTGDNTNDVLLTGTQSEINATLAAANGLRYPFGALDFHGIETLTVTTSDLGHTGSGAQSDIDTVNITVAAVADISDDTASFAEDSGAAGILVQANDSFEGTPAITATTNGAHGTVTVNNNGTPSNTADDFVVYTQAADFNGTDTFTYTVTSGGATETGTISVTITAVTDIADDSATVAQNSGANALDLLANDTFENPGRSITAVGAAAHGTTSINNNGTPGNTADDFVVYAPASGYSGNDAFTYTVASNGTTETATVSVTVSPLSTTPTPGNDSLTGTNGTDIIFALAGDDVIDGLGGADLLFGNQDDDTISGGSGSDVVLGGQGDDSVSGGTDGDVLFGNEGNDTIDGGDGTDLIFGGQDNDTILGGVGNDTIWGNEGNDTMAGGSGADRFVFLLLEGNDQINGFAFAQGDRLDLQGQSYTTGTSGDGDVVLTLARGGTVELNGIAPGSFSASFVV